MEEARKVKKSAKLRDDEPDLIKNVVLQLTHKKHKVINYFIHEELNILFVQLLRLLFFERCVGFPENRPLNRKAPKQELEGKGNGGNLRKIQGKEKPLFLFLFS